MTLRESLRPGHGSHYSAGLAGQEPIHQTPVAGQELQQHQIQVSGKNFQQILSTNS